MDIFHQSQLPLIRACCHEMFRWSCFSICSKLKPRNESKRSTRRQDHKQQRSHTKIFSPSSSTPRPFAKINALNSFSEMHSSPTERMRCKSSSISGVQGRGGCGCGAMVVKVVDCCGRCRAQGRLPATGGGGMITDGDRSRR